MTEPTRYQKFRWWFLSMLQWFTPKAIPLWFKVRKADQLKNNPSYKLSLVAVPGRMEVAAKFEPIISHWPETWTVKGLADAANSNLPYLLRHIADNAEAWSVDQFRGDVYYKFRDINNEAAKKRNEVTEAYLAGRGDGRPSGRQDENVRGVEQRTADAIASGDCPA